MLLLPHSPTVEPIRIICGLNFFRLLMNTPYPLTRQKIFLLLCKVKDKIVIRKNCNKKL